MISTINHSQFSHFFRRLNANSTGAPSCTKNMTRMIHDDLWDDLDIYLSIYIYPYIFIHIYPYSITIFLKAPISCYPLQRLHRSKDAPLGQQGPPWYRGKAARRFSWNGWISSPLVVEHMIWMTIILVLILPTDN